MKECLTLKNCQVIKREENIIHIDTDIIITDKRARKKIGLAWGVVSAVFEIQTDKGTLIPLVRRSKCTTNALKWALLPSGGIDTICELRCPNRAMEREIFEELRLYQNFEYVYPLTFHHEDSKVIIHDKAVDKKFHAYGELFKWCHTLFLIATFKSEKVFTLDNFVVFDGEKNEDDKFLHRDVALIRSDSPLDCKIKPVASYKCGKRKDNSCIDLSGFQTPTLEYLRKRRELRLKENK